jgi:hypothetical protein
MTMVELKFLAVAYFYTPVDDRCFLTSLLSDPLITDRFHNFVYIHKFYSHWKHGNF